MKLHQEYNSYYHLPFVCVGNHCSLKPVLLFLHTIIPLSLLLHMHYCIELDYSGDTGGGGSGSGGGSTPPDCNDPIPFAGTSNIVQDCDGGWEPPPPIEDDYYDPIFINGIWYSPTNFPGINNGFHWKWWENDSFLQAQGGISFGTWAINYLSLNPNLPFSTFSELVF